MSLTWMKLSPSVRGIDPVELDDDRPRCADRGVHRLDARAQRAEPVVVGRGRVDEDDVERQRAALEEPRDVRQEDRHVVGAALVDRRPRVRADEQRPVPEVAVHLGREVRPGTLGVEVGHGDVAELGGSRDEAVEEDRRGGGCAMHVHAVARLDDGRRLVRGDQAHAAKRTRPAASRRTRGPESRDLWTCRRRAGWCGLSA